MAYLIEARGLIKSYDVLPILRKLDWGVERGQFVALLGSNGAGKSTLLRILTGLSKPSGGEISIGGWRLPDEAAAVRAQIGLVSHKPLLYEALTARENLHFFAGLYGLSNQKAETRITEVLEMVGLSKRGNDRVRTYSRGMQQRLSIGRALLHEPDILLLDEPYSGLDQDAAGKLDELLRQAHRDGRTIVMSTHDLVRLPGLVQRICILSRGVIAHDALMGDMDALTLTQTYSQVTSMASAR